MKQSCREVLTELQTYLDGECGEELEVVLRRHLDDCPPCLDRADFQRELRALVASRCRDAAPSGLLDRVVATLAESRA
jgi:mycothiol system anti-sigma-R factor